jgi:predicted peroxiredoxin
LPSACARTGVPASIFLTENGAFSARRGAKSALDEALSEGVHIAVDGFALEERGIREEQLRDGVSIEAVGMIVDRLSDGCCVMWR